MAEQNPFLPPHLPPGGTPYGKVDRQKVIQWLISKFGTIPTCPMCHTNIWGIGDDVVIMPMLAQPVGVAPFITYPFVAMACSNCGYSLFFNAVVLGFVPPAQR